jgi:hypothetical protein
LARPRYTERYKFALTADQLAFLQSIDNAPDLLRDAIDAAMVHKTVPRHRHTNSCVAVDSPRIECGMEGAW